MMVLRAFVALCVARVSSVRYAAGPADRGGSRYNSDGVKDLDGLGALMALRWGGGSVVATTATTNKPSTAAAVKGTTDGHRRGRPGLRFFDGFFRRRDPNPTAVRVTYRARDADGTAAHETTTATTTTDPADETYATEPECESANDRRPCVCLVPDFLDDLLDEAKAGGAGADDRWGAECPSYQAVPKAFVVSTVAKEVAAVQATQQALTERPAAGWLPVDFDWVVRYQPEKSKDGAYYYLLVPHTRDYLESL